MKKATLCFYRIIPCFLHENTEDDEFLLIGTDWYMDGILYLVIWMDMNIFKINKLPISYTDLVLEL